MPSKTRHFWPKTTPSGLDCRQLATNTGVPSGKPGKSLPSATTSGFIWRIPAYPHWARLKTKFAMFINRLNSRK